MSKEEIVNRIISDAQAEGAEIVANAQKRAEELISSAQNSAKIELEETRAEVEAQSVRFAEVKSAAARLDCAKILLSEKRRVLNGIYARALEKLLSLGREHSLSLLSRLLRENAEEGDVVVLAKNFAYADGVAGLPVVKELGLKISQSRANISGGCILCGEKSDKDLSYSALLEGDMEGHQAELAARLFA